MGPPELSPGTYGFSVAARDASCVRYALGCAELLLPQVEGSTVLVTLEAFAGGAACAADSCSDGLCRIGDAGTMDGGDAGPPMCPAGRGDCNGLTTDGCETTLGTLEDCGACASPCAFDHATPACTAGTCEFVSCEAGWADCNGVRSDGCETSLRQVDNCGACGATCELANGAESCVSMRCELVSCYAGFADCDTTVGNGCETSLITATDCGACGRACTDVALPLCGVDAGGARTCVAACAAPAATPCGTSCVDTLSDAQACGGCMNVCRATHAAGVCAAGACSVGACDPLFRNCNGAPADGCERNVATTTDCGDCGTVCSAPTARVSCAAGTCVVDACDEGLGDCDSLGSNGCEADLASPSTCGSCGVACGAATPVCGRTPAGTRSCLAACAAPDPDPCGDRCLDTDTDEANCGGCGVLCTLPNASATCAGGSCVIGGCISGFADCDGIRTNGCETALQSSVDHCGRCGMVCGGGAGSSPQCIDGECDASCSPGFGDCDMDPMNGCEVALDTVTNCGTCGRACDPPNATGSCAGSSCSITSCDMGFGDCDGLVGNGCETNLNTDRTNCGRCAMRCSGMMSRDCCMGTCGTCA